SEHNPLVMLMNVVCGHATSSYAGMRQPSVFTYSYASHRLEEIDQLPLVDIRQRGPKRVARDRVEAIFGQQLFERPHLPMMQQLLTVANEGKRRHPIHASKHATIR